MFKKQKTRQVESKGKEQASVVCWLILCVKLAVSQCPDMWSKTILDVSVRMVFNDINV